MTVAELIEQLQKFPPGTPVFVFDGCGEYGRADEVHGDGRAVYIYP